MAMKTDSAKQGQMFIKHVLPAAVKPVHSLWHEIIGFIFSMFAIIAAFAGYRTYRQFAGDTGDLVRMFMCAIFVIIMAAYGISSFRKARKISRS
jgi:di/tricarboxylate transporter